MLFEVISEISVLVLCLIFLVIIKSLRSVQYSVFYVIRLPAGEAKHFQRNTKKANLDAA